MFKRLLLIIALAIPLMSYAQQRTFTVTINDKDYKIDEIQMNNLFGLAFQDMVVKQTTEQKYFEIWKDSFERWKDNAERGRFSWKTYGEIVGDGKYTGDSNLDDLGLDKNGKTATGNINKANNKARRMARLINYLTVLITNSVTGFKVKLK